MCFAYKRYHLLFNTDGIGNLDIKYGVTLTVDYKISSTSCTFCQNKDYIFASFI